MSKFLSNIPTSAKFCIALALAIPLGALLLQCIGGAIAEQVQAGWERDGALAMLVLVVCAEVAMIAGGE